MSTVLFDAYGLQAMAEQQLGDRLSGPTGLFDVLESAGHTVEIATFDALGHADVLFLTTRHRDPYTLDEILQLAKWVHTGGGLCCLSNHGLARTDMVERNATLFDQTVASAFGMAFEPSWNRIKPSNDPMRLAVSGVLAGQDGWPTAAGRDSNRADWVTSNNSSGLYPRPFSDTAVALEAEGLRAALADAPTTPGLAWAATLDGGPAGTGRAVFCGDSGWLGNTTSTKPGRGLFQEEDNAQFALNVVSWLTRL